MFTGYSALKLASAIPHDGEVHTFELAENHIESAKKFFSKLSYQNIFKNFFKNVCTSYISLPTPFILAVGVLILVEY